MGRLPGRLIVADVTIARNPADPAGCGLIRTAASTDADGIGVPTPPSEYRNPQF
jgi:hypothetical protein